MALIVLGDKTRDLLYNFANVLRHEVTCLQRYVNPCAFYATAFEQINEIGYLRAIICRLAHLAMTKHRLASENMNPCHPDGKRFPQAQTVHLAELVPKRFFG